MTSPFLSFGIEIVRIGEIVENCGVALARSALDSPLHFPRHRHRQSKKIPQPVLGWGLYLSRRSYSVVSYALI